MNNYIPPNLPVYIEDEDQLTPAVVLPALVVHPLGLDAEVIPAPKAVPSLSLIDFLWENKIKIAVSIFVVFFFSYTVVAAFGFLPESLMPTPDKNKVKENTIEVSSIQIEAVAETPIVVATPTPKKIVTAPKKAAAVTTTVQPSTTVAPVVKGQDPIRVIINKIGVDTIVSNPASTKPATLDEYLKRGAVRYAGSAGLGGGNTFIFAHSTNHAVVVNQAYKAFNNFDKLVAGDMVTVYSIDRVYTYKVERVRLALADELYVDLSTHANMITLSTCNTFGKKEERYVVEASFVSSAPIVENTI